MPMARTEAQIDFIDEVMLQIVLPAITDEAKKEELKGAYFKSAMKFIEAIWDDDEVKESSPEEFQQGEVASLLSLLLASLSSSLLASLLTFVLWACLQQTDVYGGRSGARKLRQRKRSNGGSTTQGRSASRIAKCQSRCLLSIRTTTTCTC